MHGVIDHKEFMILKFFSGAFEFKKLTKYNKKIE